MSLSNVLAQKSSPSPMQEKYFTCLIEEAHVTLAIWGVVNQLPKVIAIGTPKEWLELSSLSDAIELGLEEFHEQSEGIDKVLFSLPEDWVTSNDIKPSYKDVLKQVTQKLMLHPVGFVVTLEALFHYIFQFKTSAARMLYVQVRANEYRFYLTEQGQLIQQESIGRSDQFTDDMVEGLSRLTVSPLPVQMYFFSFEIPQEQLEQDKQTFLGYDWDATKLFHHLPSIDVVSHADMVEAASISGGGETIQNQHPSSASHQLHHENVPMSFTPGQNEDPTASDQQYEHQQVQPKVSSFGIPMPAKVIQELDVQNKEDSDEPKYAIDESVIEANDENRVTKKRLALRLPQIRLPSFSLPFFPRKKMERYANDEDDSRPAARSKTRPIILLTIVIGGLLAVLGAGAYGWVVLQRTAVIHITLQTVPISVDTKVALDPNIEHTDPNGKVLKVKVINQEESDTLESSTTGSKIIGDKASGTVTILNKTSNLKTFAKGTEIKLDKKTFVTDQDITVASASSKENADGQTVVYGKKDVSITAKEIGAEYNLDKESEFSIGNFGKDTYLARNEKAISGGSSREIQAVSKEDQQNMTSQLKKELIQKAQVNMMKQLADGDYLVLSGNSKVINQEYSAKVGDETEKLSVTLTVGVEGYSYKIDDLKPIAKEQLAALVPDGGALIEDEIAILSKESQEASSSGQLNLDATLTASYTPPTNSDQWLDEIQGKTLEQARQLLSEKSEIKSSTIQLQPVFAQFLVARLPNDKKKIQIIKKVE